MDNFPMEKRYWSPDDYDQVITEIRYRTPDGDKFPTITDPELGSVFKKLIDKENVSVVAEDEALGLKHRAKFTSAMFDEIRDLIQTYSVMDREDKFIYDVELVEVLKFNLFLQLHYFKLGNLEIVQESDDPEAYAVQDVLRSNERTIVSNFNLYLDFVNREKAFSDMAIASFSEGIDVYFKELINVFPKADTRPMKTKATAMAKKAESAVLRTSLTNLLSTLESANQEAASTVADNQASN
jgi:hypothetical protein